MFAAVNPANPQSWNRYSYTRNNPLNSVDPLGLDDCLGGEHMNCVSDWFGPGGGGFGMDLWGGGSLFDCEDVVGGEDCAIERRMFGGLIQNEAAFLASGSIPWYTVINGHLWLYGPTDWTTTENPNYDPSEGYFDAYIISGTVSLFDLGALAAGGSGGSGYDWSVFWHGVLHGDRQPGQSFAACVNQNIKETTFGQVDPQKLARVIPAAAVGVAGALAGKVPFNIPFDPGTGGISAFTASAYGLGRALGVGGDMMGGLVGVANGVGDTLAVAGAAIAGLVVGSAINCR
jgi:hypothetical protein